MADTECKRHLYELGFKLKVVAHVETKNHEACRQFGVLISLAKKEAHTRKNAKSRAGQGLQATFPKLEKTLAEWVPKMPTNVTVVTWTVVHLHSIKLCNEMLSSSTGKPSFLLLLDGVHNLWGDIVLLCVST